MKQFFVLFNAPVGAMQEMGKLPQEQRDEAMNAWNTWMQDNQEFFVDTGAAAGANTRVLKDSSEEVRNEVGGYSIMQAESKEALVALLQTNPHYMMPGAYIEVMEKVDM